ncbi:uncharacterized protein K452DRAFT_292840 [Aplosporella prunicola CBS 121167]|uniref:4a-hydroxytetrahydrobiopterin dehydratase n=1 Tax=Aplosporella prunicola CBS 121167 TaxID=1176127 RepID=A0A6A6AZL7_9PEZI|nr:uncharacterized protein K452DRAFT_292840 [Aplosporella prunicola CBS 121167]KAF2135911.1 hypothetical protein K452DRAFT_292840 [Aplosporella prunicola CBS 121167]
MILTRAHCLRTARGAISPIRASPAISSTARALLQRGYASDSSAPSFDDVNFSKKTDTEIAKQKLYSLTKDGQWKLLPAKNGIDRSYYFQDYKGAWRFMNSVAAEAITRNHHPEWSNFCNHVYVRWTTHRPAGLSMEDLDLALVCEKLAAEHEFAPVAQLGIQPEVMRAFRDSSFECHSGVSFKKIWTRVGRFADDAIAHDAYRLWSNVYNKLYVSTQTWREGDPPVRAFVYDDKMGFEVLKDLADKAAGLK